MVLLRIIPFCLLLTMIAFLAHMLSWPRAMSAAIADTTCLAACYSAHSTVNSLLSQASQAHCLRFFDGYATFMSDDRSA